VIPKAQVMGEFVAPFSVRSRLTREEHTVRFSHLWSAIATRHSDTIDCKFLVNGRGWWWRWRIRPSGSSASEPAARSPTRKPPRWPPPTCGVPGIRPRDQRRHAGGRPRRRAAAGRVARLPAL